jgi:hypothetical protein
MNLVLAFCLCGQCLRPVADWMKVKNPEQSAIGARRVDHNVSKRGMIRLIGG